MTTRLPRNLSRIAHFAPYRLNNSLAGIKRAKLAHFNQIDQDGQLTRDLVVVVNHWDEFWKDGLKYVVVPTKRKGARMVKGEWLVPHTYPKTKKISDLDWHEVVKLRTYSGGRLFTVTQHMRWCKERGLRMMFEVKGNHHFEDKDVAVRVMRAKESTGADVRIMTLQNVGRPLPRLKNFHAAGFETVLLARGKGVPKAWEPYITYVRGTWRRI